MPWGRPKFNPSQGQSSLNLDYEIAQQPNIVYQILEHPNQLTVPYQRFITELLNHECNLRHSEKPEEPEPEIEEKQVKTLRVLGYIDTWVWGKRRPVPKDENHNQTERIKSFKPLGFTTSFSAHDALKFNDQIFNNCIEVREVQEVETEKTESMILGEMNHLLSYGVSPFAFELGRNLGWIGYTHSQEVQIEAQKALNIKYGEQVGRLVSYLSGIENVMESDLSLLEKTHGAYLQLFPIELLQNEFLNNQFAQHPSKDKAFKDAIGKSLIVFSTILFLQLKQEVMDLKVEDPIDGPDKESLLQEKIEQYRLLIILNFRELILNLLTSAIFFNNIYTQDIQEINIEQSTHVHTLPVKSPNGYMHPYNPKVRLSGIRDEKKKKAIIKASQSERQPIALFYDEKDETITSLDEAVYYLVLKCRPDIEIKTRGQYGNQIDVYDLKTSLWWYINHQEATELYAFTYMLQMAAKLIKEHSNSYHQEDGFLRIHHFNLDDEGLLDIINNQISFNLVDLRTGELISILEYISPDKFKELQLRVREMQGALIHFHDCFRGNESERKRFFNELNTRIESQCVEM